jgi:hypothetical protein
MTDVAALQLISEGVRSVKGNSYFLVVLLLLHPVARRLPELIRAISDALDARQRRRADGRSPPDQRRNELTEADVDVGQSSCSGKELVLLPEREKLRGI